MGSCKCTHTVTVTPQVSILASDYSGLVNLPTINGVTITGDLTAKDLNLLSSSADNYETVALSTAEETDGYIVVLSKDETQATKVLLTDFVSSADSGGQTTTATTLDEEAAIGSYQYVLIE